MKKPFSLNGGRKLNGYEQLLMEVWKWEENRGGGEEEKGREKKKEGRKEHVNAGEIAEVK